jgi:hypothetical protein
MFCVRACGAGQGQGKITLMPAKRALQPIHHGRTAFIASNRETFITGTLQDNDA